MLLQSLISVVTINERQVAEGRQDATVPLGFSAMKRSVSAWTPLRPADEEPPRPLPSLGAGKDIDRATRNCGFKPLT